VTQWLGSIIRYRVIDALRGRIIIIYFCMEKMTEKGFFLFLSLLVFNIDFEPGLILVKFE